MGKTSRPGHDSTDPNISSPDTFVGPDPTAVDDEPATSGPAGDSDLPPPRRGKAVHLKPDHDAPTGSEDATAVAQNPLAARRPRARKPQGRLIVITGKEEGRVIDLRAGSIVLGRSSECDVTLLDIQVSRRHLEVTTRNGVVSIRDLGSGNGTFLNEDQVTETELNDGDEIALGDHVLRYEAEKTVTAVAPKAGGKQRRSGAGGAGVPPVDVVRRARQKRTKGDDGSKGKKIAVAAVAVAGVVAAAVFVLQPETDTPQEVGPSDAEVASREFGLGMTKFREADYEEALERFEAAMENNPEHREAQRYIVATRREIAAREDIAEGEKLLAGGNFEEARRAFGRVDPESLRHGEAQAALERVDEAEWRSVLAKADELFEEENLDEAEETYRQVLTMVSDQEDALRGLESIQEIRDRARQTTAAQREAARRAQQRRAAEQQRREQERVRQALASAQALFEQAEFDRALAAFMELQQSSNPAISGPAGEKANALRSFHPAYERGMSAADNRQVEQAISQLSRAERHARAIKANGNIHRSVLERLTDMYSLQARVAFNGRRFAIAYDNWSKALDMNPNHEQAKRGMAELLRLGEEIYLEAYMVRTLNREEAARKFRQVIAMTPPDSQPHIRSKERLEEIQR